MSFDVFYRHLAQGQDTGESSNVAICREIVGKSSIASARIHRRFTSLEINFHLDEMA
jgi:hypothetical protein